MAVTQPERHFDSPQFDAEIEAHGTPALLRPASRCPCYSPTTGQAAIDCPFCDQGLIWGDGREIRILASNRRREDVYDVGGQRLEGMVMFTFPTGINLGHLDRVELLVARMIVNNEIQVRGATDKLGRSKERLRITPSFGVETCQALVGDEPNRQLEQYVEGEDFTVDENGTINWAPGEGPPNDTQYTMRYSARPTFLIWSPQSRDEGGSRMPYRARAQRYDFFERKAVGQG
jgi:hypothetical protein